MSHRGKSEETPLRVTRNSNAEFDVGDTVGDGEGKFRISGSYGDGKSILQIVNFSVRDEDMYRCDGVLLKYK
jgi:hypothetical protein